MCLLPRLQQTQLKQYKITIAIKTSEQIRQQLLRTCPQLGAELQAGYFFCSTRDKVMPIQNLEFEKLWQQR